MRSTRSGCFEFDFDEKEIAEIDSASEDIVSQLKKQNLTYGQAVEVLEQCKIKLQMSLLK